MTVSGQVKKKKKTKTRAGKWGHTHLNPAGLGTFCKFKASLVYRASSRTVRTTQKNPVLKDKKEKARE